MAGDFHEVRDPVHGFITFNDWEREIINHPVMQRLRRIRQLAWTEMVYPGATHCRLEHSLGVMHVATQMFDGICEKEGNGILRADLKYKQDGLGRERAKVRLAALLHDVGHTPFSHAGEELMPTRSGKIAYTHEDYSAAIISNLMRDVIEDHPFNANNYKITVEEIANFLKGTPAAGASLIWRPLITGQIDADRADYLLRDSIHCGVEYGRYDLRRILVTLTLARDQNDNPVLAVEEGGWHAAEGLIISRYMMFTQVYFHPTRRSYDHHIGKVLEFALGKQGSGKNKFPPPDTRGLKRYFEWDDWRILGLINNNKAGLHGEVIRERKHDRWVHQTPEVPSTQDLQFLETVVEDLGDQVTFVDEASKSWYSLGAEDLLIRPLASERGMPLSRYSSIVSGLKPVNQKRVYVDLNNAEKSRRRVNNLKVGDKT